MKKNRALVMVLLATAALGFMGCTSTYTGTVKVKIFNSADVPLTVSSIAECDNSVLGSYEQEGTTIAVDGNKEFGISCSSSYHTQVEDTIIHCHYISGSSYIYPYAGCSNGTSVTIYTSGTVKQRTSEYKFVHPYLELKSSNPGTITVVYNFVKTTDGDYVLCIVK